MSIEAWEKPTFRESVLLPLHHEFIKRIKGTLGVNYDDAQRIIKSKEFWQAFTSSVQSDLHDRIRERVLEKIGNGKDADTVRAIADNCSLTLREVQELNRQVKLKVREVNKRNVYRMVHDEGKSLDDIAFITNMGKTTVHRLLRQAEEELTDV